MTKAELIKKMADAAGITQVAAGIALDSAIWEITDAHKTQIKGFGTFMWKIRKARTCRNPRTGVDVDVPESTTLHFKPSAGMKGS